MQAKRAACGRQRSVPHAKFHEFQAKGAAHALIAVFSLVLAGAAPSRPPAAKASAPGPSPFARIIAEPGWVKPEPGELVRVFGERLKAKVNEPPLLAINSEEWTSPYISYDRERLFYGTSAGILEARSLSSWSVLWTKKTSAF